MSQNAHGPRAFVQAILGIDPLMALFFVCVDTTLHFTRNDYRLFISAFVSLTFSIILSLVQKYYFGDEWGAAIGKGMMIGVLIAVPTPLLSVITASAGLIARKRIDRSS